jgi:hypothetical protein
MMKEAIKRLERRLKDRPGIVRRIVWGKQATAEDLAAPRVLVVDIHTVTRGEGNEYSSDRPAAWAGAETCQPHDPMAGRAA